jgi:gas vesicle protein
MDYHFPLNQETIMSEENNGGGIGWFIAGLGLGALIGLLFAPKSGSETRDLLASRANEGRDYLRNQSQTARDSVGQWIDRGKEAIDRGKDMVDRQKQQVQSAFESARQAYRETTGSSGGSGGPGQQS